ncbi:S-adenosyl-L-methionine-dependent methyltransferase [Penicillium angulare]|uniref:S-adenosyl-L-methionine-dependent methyltransferase n=1 Tax=Penicillium angulare TaxID=116970 RepID=A0A9W9G8N8_9EURO|nr:S-adenosyl-L-methionine-dependent methyltransferase [Penicillium angulare]
MNEVYEKHMLRNEVELSRLTGQYNIISENLGYHIHPTIAARLPKNPRVADIGTASGLFLSKIAPMYPKATLDGYDISSAFFPPETPSNINLSILDARQPIPKDLEGIYDLVHVLFLCMGLFEEDWTPIVANLSLLLKPGGALQWEECNFLASTWYRFYPESTYEAVYVMEKLLLDAFASHMAYGYDTLPGDMEAAGLTDIGIDIIGSDRVKSTLALYTAVSMGVCFNWARSGRDPIPYSKEQLDQLEAQSFRDIASGGYVRFDIHTNWGFRPLPETSVV